MTEEWPDDWPVAAIRKIEEADDEIEHLRHERDTIRDNNDALGDENGRLRELLREARDRMAWSPENMKVVRRIDAALCSSDQPSSAAMMDEFDCKRFESAPCFKCGYNGQGYFNPAMHPCAGPYQTAMSNADPTPPVTKTGD